MSSKFKSFNTHLKTKLNPKVFYEMHLFSKTIHNFEHTTHFQKKTIYDRGVHETRDTMIITDWTYDVIRPIGNS